MTFTVGDIVTGGFYAKIIASSFSTHIASTICNLQYHDFRTIQRLRSLDPETQETAWYRGMYSNCCLANHLIEMSSVCFFSCSNCLSV